MQRKITEHQLYNMKLLFLYLKNQKSFDKFLRKIEIGNLNHYKTKNEIHLIIFDFRKGSHMTITPLIIVLLIILVAGALYYSLGLGGE